MSAWITIAVPTRWLESSDDLGLALAEHLPALNADDTIVISEKVAVVLTGGSVPISSLHVGLLARFLARKVRPREGSRGLSVPAKMQYVVQTLGRARVTSAVLCAGVTRPLGHRGAFYRVAGSLARDLDGARPPYEHVLIPPMPSEQASELCTACKHASGSVWPSWTSTTSAERSGQPPHDRYRPPSYCRYSAATRSDSD